MKTYKETIELLAQRQMKKAISLQKNEISKFQDWALFDEVVNIEETYGMMLKYFSEGVDDQKRKEVYDSLVSRMLVLAEKTKRQYGFRNLSTAYYSKLRAVSRQSRTLLYYTNRLQAHNPQTLFDSITSVTSEMADLPRRTLVEELFDYIWVAAVFTEEEYSEIIGMFDKSYLSVAEKQWLASAVTLSLLCYYDVNKLELLVSLTDNENPKVACRAIVGLSLLMLYHRERFSIEAPHRLLDFRPDLSSTWCMLQVMYFTTSNTKRLRKQMETDLMPLMMNIQHKVNPEKLQDILEDEEADLPAGIDPEIVRKIRNSMQSMNDQAIRGFDIYYSNCSALKNYPFFTEIKNWFKPFELNSLGKEHFLNRIGEMLGGNSLCDSDKYSIAATMTSMPDSFKGQIDKVISDFGLPKSKDNNLNDNLSVMRFQQLQSAFSFSLSPDECLAFATTYMQDIYRFFTIKMRNDEEGNPFVGNEDFVIVDSDFIIPRITLEDLAITAAEAYDQRLNRQTICLYSLLSHQRKLTTEEQLKVAHSCAMLEDYQSALDIFESLVDSKQPISNEMLCVYASCLLAEGLTDVAKDIFGQLYEEDESSVSPCVYAMTLKECDCIDEALDVLFKEDYFRPGQSDVEKLMVDCLLINGKADKALKYVEKLIQKNEDLDTDFLLNAAHTYLALGQNVEAIRLYRVVKDSDSSWQFTENDRVLLNNLNVSDFIISLVEDAV